MVRVSLQKLLGIAHDPNNALDFQLNRDTDFSWLEKKIYGILAKDRLAQIIIAGCTFDLEYFTEGWEIKPIQGYKFPLGPAEIAWGPHLLGREELVPMFTLYRIISNRRVFTLSKIENFRHLGGLSGSIIALLGGFPIERYNPSRKAINIFYRLVADENKVVAITPYGTRTSSGLREEIYNGLFAAIIADLKDHNSREHSIVPIAMSYDAIDNRTTLTVLDPIVISNEDLGTAKKKKSLS